MRLSRRVNLLAATLASCLCIVLTISAPTCVAATIKAAGAAYTGYMNVRQSSSVWTLVAPTGTITCANATGANPRLGSFGYGQILYSNVPSTPSTIGTLIRASAGNQLLAVGGGVVHNDTTAVVSGGVPNTTPRCTSTIPAISGGCVAETSGSTAATLYANTNSATTAAIRLTIAFDMYCKDSSGNNVSCRYVTGSGGSAPMTSNPFPLNAGGNTNPSTVVFSNAAMFRIAGSTLCPPGGAVGSANAIKFSSSFHLYTGWSYPGVSGIYFE